MRTFVSGKIHGLLVTAKALHYDGSQTIPQSLMTAIGLKPYEQVHCLNVNNGNRWVTYAIPGPEGVCALNGSAARQGEIGDELIVIAYRSEERFSGASVIWVTDNRKIVRDKTYAAE